jgi:hypothetical protein
MKLDNPPSPPFSKGGLGGFGCLVIGYWNLFGACNLVIGYFTGMKKSRRQ